MATVIHLRRGTASDNPVLADGEPGFHTGTGEIRIGDGSTAWDDLPSTNRFLSEDILSGTYRKDDRPLVLGAGALETHDSAAIVGTGNGRWGAWALDDSSTERLTGVVDIPATWATFDLDVWHTTTTGNQGTVVVNTGVRELVAGNALGTDDAVSGFTSISAVGTDNDMAVDTILSGATAPSGPTLMRFARSGGDASDDLTGDWMLLAVVLRKAS